MLTFDEPGFILLIIPLPLIFYMLYLRKKRGGGIPFSFHIWNGRHVTFTTPAVSFINVGCEILLWIALFSYIIALSGPAVSTNRKVYVERGMDMMIVLDQSPSMAARDFGAEDRLTTAREMIKGFTKGRENDSLGLVTFSEEAVLRLPPTVDHDLLIDSLDSISLMNRGDGTAIGMGVALAVLHLSSSTAGEKAILLITDGENNVGEIQPETAASMAAQMGIRIYSIGLGTSGEVPIELTDRESGKILTGTLQSRFDGELLEKISDISGGNYFYARSSGSLETIFQAIDTLESHEVKTKVVVDQRFLHGELILLGSIALLLRWIIRRLIMGAVV